MPLKTTQDDELQVNLTSMIDVVFLLVIFFMAATRFTEMERDIELELPQVTAAGAPAPAPAKPIAVTVLQGGRYKIDGEELTIEALGERLRAATSASADAEVVIHGDAGCEFQHVAAALAVCRESNVEQLGVTVEVASAGSPNHR
ncbi:Biopolymer transport protein ExbD [Pseudobythopirellula maris]|uniref:Biopolymer transport protein ExbD n=1 Tax=Pseudobythopirellula maris TaxID=2527991 RepID=A0A5C5ZH27_9BACT|nr:biopolymer transporter ExbD [Pseudobythopirellula maris]TWT86624.1 Biopolymer transport protein ExbD [Pseudobythopirellula maris]